MQARREESRLAGFFWAVVIGLGTYMVLASAVAHLVGWFN